MHRQSAPPVICLMMDRLSVGMLGAYGNTWIGTPCFDRLAFPTLALPYPPLYPYLYLLSLYSPTRPCA